MEHDIDSEQIAHNLNFFALRNTEKLLYSEMTEREIWHD